MEMPRTACECVCVWHSKQCEQEKTGMMKKL